MVYVFTGDGKGKTSAALGVALRAVGHRKKTAIIQFYKEKQWNIGEHHVSVIPISSPRHPENHSLCHADSDPGAAERDLAPGRQLRGGKNDLFHIYPMGKGFYHLPTDHVSKTEHQKAAGSALKLAEKLLSANNAAMRQCGNLFLLVLDEVINAVSDKLISQASLFRLIEKRGAVHLILTGRQAPKKLIDFADLATEMKNIKHPHDIGRKAVLGLDY